MLTLVLTISMALVASTGTPAATTTASMTTALNPSTTAPTAAAITPATASNPPAPATSMEHLSLSVDPTQVKNGNATELICRVTIPEKATTCSIDVQPPLGFKAEPHTLAITGLAPSVVVRKVTLTPVDAYQVSGTKNVRADLAATGTGGAIVLSESTRETSFDYVSDRLGIRLYLWLGFAGIIIGYLLRFSINLLKTIPAPSSLVLETEGPITDFVKEHYYWFDGFVTVVLGMIILLSMIKNDLPPEAATRWYGAMVLGTAVGTLTNSELLTRLVAGIPRSTGVALVQKI